MIFKIFYNTPSSKSFVTGRKHAFTKRKKTSPTSQRTCQLAPSLNHKAFNSVQNLATFARYYTKSRQVEWIEAKTGIERVLSEDIKKGRSGKRVEELADLASYT